MSYFDGLIEILIGIGRNFSYLGFFEAQNYKKKVQILFINGRKEFVIFVMFLCPYGIRAGSNAQTNFGRVMYFMIPSLFANFYYRVHSSFERRKSVNSIDKRNWA